MEEEATKNCPFCGEEVKTEAKKCKHCQENITDKICPFCGEEIKALATKCRHCKSELKTTSPSSQETKKSRGMIGFSITSLVLGIWGVITSLGAIELIRENPYRYNKGDLIAGVLFYLIINLIFGILAIYQNRAGKGMAIAGIILGIISFLLMQTL